MTKSGRRERAGEEQGGAKKEDELGGRPYDNTRWMSDEEKRR